MCITFSAVGWLASKLDGSMFGPVLELEQSKKHVKKNSYYMKKKNVSVAL